MLGDGHFIYFHYLEGNTAAALAEFAVSECSCYLLHFSVSA